MSDVRLGVLVSGSGTILEALVDSGIAVAVVVADRDCRALEVAAAHGIVHHVVDRAQFGGFKSTFDRSGYTLELEAVLSEARIDLVAMAGFGTITTGSLYKRFPGRVLNTHPSLLPQFKGWHAVRDALDAAVTQSGCTVHVATESLDSGPVLAQRRVDVWPDDDESSLHERIKVVERELYPEVIRAVISAMEQGLEPSSIAPFP